MIYVNKTKNISPRYIEKLKNNRLFTKRVQLLSVVECYYGLFKDYTIIYPRSFA